MNRSAREPKGETTRCWACGTPAYVEQHHVIPKRYGGDDSEGNLVALCPTCHDLIDRKGLITVEGIAWFMREQSIHKGPRWANLLLLLSGQLAAAFKQTNDPKSTHEPLCVVR